LGPVLFLVFTNDLDYGIKNWILKFVDDTKFSAKINTAEDHINLQRDLDKLVRWSEEWQIVFNVGKCKVMHFGRSNPSNNYNKYSTCLSVFAVMFTKAIDIA